MARLLKHSVVLVLIALTISAASAADNSMFNYQGRVLVQGMPYTGTGRMKAAIIATTGTSTVVSLWSNDGTSSGGNEPTNSFDVSVTAGVFDVMIGDANAGMATIPAIMFNRDDELKVRVWFNDGTHGYQQLTPDRRLTHPRRLGITEVRGETTIYVNAATGNDLNSGLSASTAKKTIQAAVNMVPARLFANLTIDVATGIYRESVKISGITAEDGCKFTLLGDETTIPSDTVSPDVRITGADNDSTHAKVRPVGVKVTSCANVEIKGFLFDYFSDSGVYVKMGQAFITQCKSSYNTSGGFFLDRTTANMTYCWASYDRDGYLGYTQSHIALGNSGASDCTGFGILAQGYCTVHCYAGNYIKRNLYGIGMQSSYLWFEEPTTYVTNNTTGIYLYYHSSSRLIGYVSYSGNGTNQTVGADSWAN